MGTGFQVVEQARDAGQETVSVWGDKHAFGAAVEQGNLQGPFKTADGLGDGRLAEMDLGSGGADALAFGDLLECP